MKINKNNFSPPDSTFAAWQDQHLNLVESALATALEPLAENQPPEVAKLVEGMAYSLLGGGKRLRPLLTLAAAEAVGGKSRAALPAALAVELIHAYSLVHDDLPAMDDDDLRRGRPTCHKVYGEGSAILVGDALLTLAFEVLGQAGFRDQRAASRVVLATLALARAAGARGMVGGQALDLAFEGRAEEIDEAGLHEMAGRKTAELISVALLLGGIFGGGSSREQMRFQALGHQLGLAFQIQDDLLNLDGDPAQLGKSVGSDEKRGKACFPVVLGGEAARVLGEKYLARSLDLAAAFGPGSQHLVQLIENLVRRQS